MKIDYDSSVNQKIKGQFVQREVKACFSYEMDAILRCSDDQRDGDLPTIDQIDNFYLPTCQNCGYSGNFTVPDNGETFICPSCKTVTDEEPETQPQEIFEWWIVTEFLYRKLKAHGEPVLEWGNNCYWGRTCCGQAISLDWVIGQICEEMEILSGQKYSWKEK